MVRVPRNLGKLIPSVLAVVIATGFSVTCAAAAAEMTAAEKACCAEMAGCEGMSADNDCCPSTSSLLTATLSTAPLLHLAPPVAIRHIGPVHNDAASLVDRATAFDVDAIISASPPAYLLGSVFRI